MQPSGFGILALTAGASMLSFPARAGLPPPREDAWFLGEHLAEAAQDARYFAQPLLPGDLDDTQLHPWVSVGAASFGMPLADAKGGMFTFGMSARTASGRAWSLAAFADRFKVSSGTQEDILTGFNLPGIPLDIPEQASFSNATGHFSHQGVVAMTSILHDHIVHGGSLTASSGMFIEHLGLSGYGMHYRLTGGASAGAEGELHLDSDSWFLTPFIALQYDYSLGERFHLVPSTALGWPLPAGDINTRLTGPDFSVDNINTDMQPAHIGDGWLRLGLGLRDRQSGLDYELGTLASFPVLERVTHQGIDAGLLLSVTWHLH
jgi:hypothetical protein